MNGYNVARIAFVGLALLLVFVVLTGGPGDEPGEVNPAAGEATDAPAGFGGADGALSQPAPEGTVATTPADANEPPLTGCFRSGSTRAEVRAAMGEPDQVVAGVWEYGESWVSFGYGTVLDYRNDSGNLRLCDD